MVVVGAGGKGGGAPRHLALYCQLLLNICFLICGKETIFVSTSLFRTEWSCASQILIPIAGITFKYGIDGYYLEQELSKIHAWFDVQ